MCYYCLSFVLSYNLQQLGEVAKITCTPDYAYGAGGFPAWGIMPDSVLAFEIEVLSFEQAICQYITLIICEIDCHFHVYKEKVKN